MNAVTYSAFSDELCLIKEAQWETIRHGFKALKGSLLGGTKLLAKPGVMQAPRAQAAKAGKGLIHNLEQKGMKVHRARVKTPESIQAKGLTDVPDDLLGMQMYGKSHEDVVDAVRKLRAQGVEGIRYSAKARPGYHGVNIKGRYQGVPLELQVNPGRISNMGQQLEHALGYKAKTEAPRSTFIDRWVGKKIAPRMVKMRSWVPEMTQKPRIPAWAIPGGG
jgi:hypothetical protein